MFSAVEEMMNSPENLQIPTITHYFHLFSIALIKHWPKQFGKERVYLVYKLQPITEGSQERHQSRHYVRKLAADLFPLICSAQNHQSGDGTAPTQ